jgi:general secretion pathway protein C
MFYFSLKNIRYINFVIIVFIVILSLVIIRSIVNISFSKKVNYSGPLDGNRTGKAIKGMNIMQFSPVLQKNPFGGPMQLQPIGGGKVTETGIKSQAPITDLTLVGTVVGPRPISCAVFQNKTDAGRQEIFTYGEQVYNYGKLIKIRRSEVDIQRDGQVYSLKIDYEKSSGAPITVPARRRTGKRSVSRGTFAKQIGEREYLLDRDKVQRSIENPEKVLTDARLLPNIINGKQEGFKISEVVPDGLYHSLGLRNGDILLNINGLEISNPEVAIQAMSALKGMNRINLDIVRNGENMSIDYQIR